MQLSYGAGLAQSVAVVTTAKYDAASAADAALLGPQEGRRLLDTVIHAGGILKDALLRDQTCSGLREVRWQPGVNEFHSNAWGTLRLEINVITADTMSGWHWQNHGLSCSLSVTDREPFASKLLCQPPQFELPGRAASHARSHPPCQQVSAPKLAALAHLSLACALQPVGRAVLFSSVASLLGTAGQATYAAASGGLDGWAAAARDGGCDAVSVQWGAWAAPGTLLLLLPFATCFRQSPRQTQATTNRTAGHDLCFDAPIHL
jgi:hypothetical protein